MTRFPDWPERLAAFLRSCHGRVFRWGSWDCCLFVAGAVLAMTGTDIAAELRGKYRSRREARELAQPSMREFLEAQLSYLPAVIPQLAQRGDIVLLKHDEDYSLGLVDLSGRRIVKPGNRGLVCVTTEAVKAWHV